MARSFVPDAAGGFQGASCTSSRGPPPAPSRRGGRSRSPTATPARAPAPATDAALTLRFTLADFVRIAAGTIDPAEPLLANRASFEGDFALAARLPEMFGAPSPY